jgi:tetratricopeptide (TPR) repeat protein
MRLYNEANADFTHALEINPQDVHALADRGDIYNHLKRYAEGIVDLTQAVELDPQYSRAKALRGESYSHLKQYDEALADYTAAIELAPTNIWAIGRRSKIYLILGRYDDALDDLNRIMEVATNADLARVAGVNTDDYVQVAVDLLVSGRRMEAATIFEKLSLISPGDPRALNNWAFCIMPDSAETALELLGQALCLYSEANLISVANRLRCLLQLGLYEAALIVADEIIGELPTYRREFAYMWSLDDFILSEVDDVRRYIIDLVSRIVNAAHDERLTHRWTPILTETLDAVNAR